ncbi:MAG: iron-containing alcohol dehydrogenase [FCB group bacterium]|jgi:alcohol dehydrogenase YqhD (iron-dependent ADH family)
MENFIFHNPTKIIFGENTITSIGKEINKAGIKNILLLAGAGSIKRNGVYDQVVSSLGVNKIEFVEHWGVRANPSLKHALEGIKIVMENKLEAVLAVGGGSVIDEGKSIAAGYYLDNLWDVFERKAIINKALPIFTILTLSGTGSEMDPHAVITNDEENKKWPIGSPLLYPKVSIIDPTVQMSLPWEQTVYGAIDAMSHLMEFYFMGTEPEATIAIDESLFKTIIKSVDQLQANQKDYNARANLAWAATLALNGLSGISLGGGDWATHRIEHSISAFHPEVAHGAGLAVIFPAWVKYVNQNNPSQFLRWAQNVWNSGSIEDAIEAMIKKYKSWNAPVSLRDLNISGDEFPVLASYAVMDGTLGFVKKLNKNDVENILLLAN